MKPAVAAALLFFGVSAAQAQTSVADFYKGKTITLQVGSEPAGGYDIVARVVAQFMPRHIPGEPTMVVQFVPGGGSLRLANQMGSGGTPNDGTVIGLASNGMPTTPLLSPDAAKYDPTKFYFLGTPTHEVEVLVVWHEAPVKNFDEIFTKEMIVGASAPGSATFDFPLVTNQILGTKFKIVVGYRGATEVKLAMQRGEVHANAALAWGSAKTQYADLMRNGTLKVMAQYGHEKAPDMPDVPLMKFGKTDADQQVLDILYSRGEYGRPFFLPAGVPAERAQALRKAFADTMNDPAFKADAEKAKLDLDPVSGEALETLTHRLLATPQNVVQRTRDMLDPTKQK
jgi:tripartite-type tricarboxylate transporter receptor subunit TctC